ncbi:hypothetical protein ACJ67_14240 [Methylophilus sp. TWE2]|nr:hypothetical protein ACJ67_14240 [Methylophilus sp. TWE2]
MALLDFSGPYLPRRVAQSAWEVSASGCSSSAVACVVCKLLGRVSLDALADEQRRKQAEARVHFLLVTLSLGKQRKVTRRGAKENITDNKKPSAWAYMPTLPLNVSLVWISTCAQIA